MIGDPKTSNAFNISSGPSTAWKGAALKPTLSKYFFSTNRSWAVARARAFGRAGFNSASRVRAASGTFSNSTVMESTLAAKASSAG